MILHSFGFSLTLQIVLNPFSSEASLPVPSCQILCSSGLCPWSSPLSHLHNRRRPYNEDTRTPAPLPCWRYPTVLLSTRQHCRSEGCCASVYWRRGALDRFQSLTAKPEQNGISLVHRNTPVTPHRQRSVFTGWLSHHSVNVCLRSWRVLRPRYYYYYYYY